MKIRNEDITRFERWICAIILLLAIIFIAGRACGETLYDENYNRQGTISEDGRIYNKSGEYKGKVKDGRIYDEHYNVKGYYKDGRLYDKDYNRKGSYEDGQLYNKDGQRKGYVK